MTEYVGIEKPQRYSRPRHVYSDRVGPKKMYRHRWRVCRRWQGRGLRAVPQISRVSSADLDRDTQMMISLALSRSERTKSRWSACPVEYLVRHVPHVPLSHELGSLCVSRRGVPTAVGTLSC